MHNVMRMIAGYVISLCLSAAGVMATFGGIISARLEGWSVSALQCVGMGVAATVVGFLLFIGLSWRTIGWTFRSLQAGRPLFTRALSVEDRNRQVNDDGTILAFLVGSVVGFVLMTPLFFSEIPSKLEKLGYKDAAAQLAPWSERVAQAFRPITKSSH